MARVQKWCVHLCVWWAIASPGALVVVHLAARSRAPADCNGRVGGRDLDPVGRF